MWLISLERKGEKTFNHFITNASSVVIWAYCAFSTNSFANNEREDGSIKESGKVISSPSLY
jgi:hypothetical protein